MPFFTKSKGSKNKSKAPASGKRKNPTKTAPRKPDDNDNISSSDESDQLNGLDNDEEYEEIENEDETPQEKRLKLAKSYLKELEQAEKKKLENQELDDACKNDAIQQRLKEDYLKQTGRFKVTVADSYKSFGEHSILKCKNHKSAITAVCLNSDGSHIYSGSKDGKIVMWSFKEKKKVLCAFSTKSKEGHHPSNVLSLAISLDNKFLAVGDSNCSIQIFNAVNLEHLKTFSGHKNSVTGLAFRKGTYTLYSCSLDRSIKVWTLDEMMYVETLYGHLDGVTMIDALTRERAVTSGGKDSTIRMWKIPEESQLVYNGDFGSMDIVKLINEDTFVSGGDNGHIYIWGVNKKKPLCNIPNAHGNDSKSNQPNWICAITALVNSDLIATGSYDNCVRLWKLSDGFKSLKEVLTIPVAGFVNTLNFTSDGKFLIAGVGGEHRLGRWNVIKGVKNCLIVIPLLKS